jgi:hypothetical protein
MSFRIGRKGAQHSYPVSRGAMEVPRARNFAAGPTATEPITVAGIFIPWSLIEAGAPAGINVPITPRSSGIILIQGVITIKNAVLAPIVASMFVWVNGTPLIVPFMETVLVPASGSSVIPFLTETAPLPIGVPAIIQIAINAASEPGLSLLPASSTMAVQEVRAATG